MNATSPTLLTFNYDVDEQRLNLEGILVSHWDERDRQIGRLSVAELIEYKKTFRNDIRNLERRHDKYLSYKHDPAYVGRMLLELMRAGRKFWRNVSGGDAPWLWNLSDAIRPVLAHDIGNEWWLHAAPAHIGQTVSQVETKGPPGALLPLDALPLAETERAIVAADEADVRLLASYLGGYSAVVRYTPLIAAAFVHPKAQGNRCTLYFRSVDAEFFDRMHEVLNEQAGVLLGPFPSGDTYADAEDVARSLMLPEPARGPIQLVPDLVHMHAHAVEGDSNAEALMITLDSGMGVPIVVLSSHVEDVLHEVSRIRRAGTNPNAGPIVVFNSCEALGLVGHEPRSTGLDLSLGGTRAVVGPREEVDAEFAVGFSRELHSGLGEGRAVGECVVRARWATLTEYLNPSGLFYATFGDVETTRSTGSLPLGE